MEHEHERVIWEICVWKKAINLAWIYRLYSRPEYQLKVLVLLRTSSNCTCIIHAGKFTCHLPLMKMQCGICLSGKHMKHKQYLCLEEFVAFTALQAVVWQRGGRKSQNGCEDSNMTSSEVPSSQKTAVDKNCGWTGSSWTVFCMWKVTIVQFKKTLFNSQINPQNSLTVICTRLDIVSFLLLNFKQANLIVFQDWAFRYSSVLLKWRCEKIRVILIYKKFIIIEVQTCLIHKEFKCTEQLQSFKRIYIPFLDYIKCQCICSTFKISFLLLMIT